MYYRQLTLLTLIAVIAFCSNCFATDTVNTIDTRYSIAASGAQLYSPGNEVTFGQLSLAALFDYDRVWPHAAPQPLRFKVEGSAGVANTPHARAIISANMFALYFLDALATPRFKPYFEAGIGIIYTDYQLPDQGLRFNFNPQLGMGTEITTAGGRTWFTAVRLHHISNCGLDDDNGGVNSVMLQIGCFFSLD